MRPAEYPPPFRARDYVAAPTDSEDERIEVGLLIVGAGPAGLACAIRFAPLLETAPDVRERPAEVRIAVLEKGTTRGSQLPAGAAGNARGRHRLLRSRTAL